MKTVVLAAGYATRLYPLTENFPKPLLEIGSSTILGRMLDDIDGIPEVSEHIVVSNGKFAPIFEQWASKLQSLRKPVRVLSDETFTNETRLGAVRDLLLAIEKFSLDEDLLVLAADNILDFSLKGFVEEFKKKGTSMIMCHYEPEIYKLQRTGVIEVDDDMKVLQMQEKPQEPVSHWAVPPFYIYRREDLPLIKGAIDGGCGFDAPGNLAHYLVDRTEIHAWKMPAGRFDIGSLDTYEQAKIKYQ
ncbi:MAG: nucleotidyltransferase family protein [Bacteroidales bacterium]|nr:nucleotidyltransferase family protein [Bacteroidales bacterium]